MSQDKPSWSPTLSSSNGLEPLQRVHALERF
jgi:hypothetical protein